MLFCFSTARASGDCYDYFIYDQNKNLVESIGDIKQDCWYSIPTGNMTAGSSAKVGSAGKVSIQKPQESEVYPCEWKNYEFDVYALGDLNSTEDRHQLLNRDKDKFWDTSDSAFNQAVAKHMGNITPAFKNTPKGYILARDEGMYVGNMEYLTCKSEEISDTGRLKKKIESKGGSKRTIIQVGSKTKCFWKLLEVDKTAGEVDVCGGPSKIPQSGLELEPRPDAVWLPFICQGIRV